MTALLAAYVNGRCTAEQVSEVEKAIKENPELSEDLSLLRSVRHALRTTQIEDPGEFVLARLKREWLGNRKQSNARPSFWPKITALAACLAVALLVVDIQMRQTSDYSPLSSQAMEGFVVQIRFHPDATQSQISELLGNLGGEIVSGPGGSNLYRVRFDSDSQFVGHPRFVIDELIARSDLVIYARQEE